MEIYNHMLVIVVSVLSVNACLLYYIRTEESTINAEHESSVWTCFKKNKNKKINDNKTNKKKIGSIHVLLTCYAQISFEPITADGPKAFPKMHRIT